MRAPQERIGGLGFFRFSGTSTGPEKTVRSGAGPIVGATSELWEAGKRPGSACAIEVEGLSALALGCFGFRVS